MFLSNISYQCLVVILIRLTVEPLKSSIPFIIFGFNLCCFVPTACDFCSSLYQLYLCVISVVLFCASLHVSTFAVFHMNGTYVSIMLLYLIDVNFLYYSRAKKRQEKPRGRGGQYKIDNPETQADVGIPHKTNRNKTNKCETENKIKHNTENKNRRTKHGVDPTCSGRVSHSCLLYKTPVVLLIDKAVFHSFCVSAHVLWFFQYPIAIVHVSHFCCFVPAHII